MTVSAKKEISSDLWPEIMAQIPSDAEAIAKQSGLLRYHRAFSSFSDLLRLAFAYALLDYSLRTLAPWAAAQRICKPISDVGVMKQLQKMGPCLEILITRILLARSEPSGLPPGIVLLDGTAFAGFGSTEADWRIHLLWHASEGMALEMKVLPASSGEPSCSELVREGDLLVADRHSCNRKTFSKIHQEGAAFLIRATRTMPLWDANGQKVRRNTFFQDHPKRGRTIREHTVFLQDGAVRIPTRLVIVRNTETAYQKALKKRARKKSKKGVTTADSPEALEAAHYTCFLTTIPKERATMQQVALLYRARWQIELCFKRWKSLLDLTNLRAQQEDLARTYILTKLLVVLLMEEALHQASFSPWGSRSCVLEA